MALFLCSKFQIISSISFFAIRFWLLTLKIYACLVFQSRHQNKFEFTKTNQLFHLRQKIWSLIFRLSSKKALPSLNIG